MIKGRIIQSTFALPAVGSGRFSASLSGTAAQVEYRRTSYASILTCGKKKIVAPPFLTELGLKSAAALFARPSWEGLAEVDLDGVSVPVASVSPRRLELARDSARTEFVVTDLYGLHIRPSTMIASLASMYRAELYFLGPQGGEFLIKDVMSMVMQDVPKGGQVVFSAKGDQAWLLLNTLKSANYRCYGVPASYALAGLPPDHPYQRHYREYTERYGPLNLDCSAAIMDARDRHSIIDRTASAMSSNHVPGAALFRGKSFVWLWEFAGAAIPVLRRVDIKDLGQDPAEQMALDREIRRLARSRERTAGRPSVRLFYRLLKRVLSRESEDWLKRRLDIAIPGFSRLRRLQGLLNSAYDRAEIILREEGWNAEGALLLAGREKLAEIRAERRETEVLPLLEASLRLELVALRDDGVLIPLETDNTLAEEIVRREKDLVLAVQKSVRELIKNSHPDRWFKTWPGDLPGKEPGGAFLIETQPGLALFSERPASPIRDGSAGQKFTLAPAVSPEVGRQIEKYLEATLNRLRPENRRQAWRVFSDIARKTIESRPGSGREVQDQIDLYFLTLACRELLRHARLVGRDSLAGGRLMIPDLVSRDKPLGPKGVVSETDVDRELRRFRTYWDKLAGQQASGLETDRPGCISVKSSVETMIRDSLTTFEMALCQAVYNLRTSKDPERQQDYYDHAACLLTLLRRTFKDDRTEGRVLFAETVAPEAVAALHDLDIRLVVLFSSPADLVTSASFPKTPVFALADEAVENILKSPELVEELAFDGRHPRPFLIINPKPEVRENLRVAIENARSRHRRFGSKTARRPGAPAQSMLLYASLLPADPSLDEIPRQIRPGDAVFFETSSLLFSPLYRDPADLEQMFRPLFERLLKKGIDIFLETFNYPGILWPQGNVLETSSHSEGLPFLIRTTEGRQLTEDIFEFARRIGRRDGSSGTGRLILTFPPVGTPAELSFAEKTYQREITGQIPPHQTSRFDLALTLGSRTAYYGFLDRLIREDRRQLVFDAQSWLYGDYSRLPNQIIDEGESVRYLTEDLYHVLGNIIKKRGPGAGLLQLAVIGQIVNNPYYLAALVLNNRLGSSSSGANLRILPGTVSVLLNPYRRFLDDLPYGSLPDLDRLYQAGGTSQSDWERFQGVIDEHWHKIFGS